MSRLLLFTSLLTSLSLLACGESEDPVHPSYDPCAPGESCGLMTSCVRAALTTTDAGGAVSLCSRACTNDIECPGSNARCVPVTSDAGSPMGQCLRVCASSLDCRDGTSCHAVLLAGRREGVCVRDTGARPCGTDGECAPFVDTCVRSDAGVGAADGAATGTCRLSATAR